MDLYHYIEIAHKRFQPGIAGEHIYPTDFESITLKFVPGFETANAPLIIEAAIYAN